MYSSFSLLLTAGASTTDCWMRPAVDNQSVVDENQCTSIVVSHNSRCFLEVVGVLEINYRSKSSNDDITTRDSRDLHCLTPYFHRSFNSLQIVLRNTYVLLVYCTLYVHKCRVHIRDEG